MSSEKSKNGGRLFGSGVLSLLLWAIPVMLLSGVYMDLAALIIGEKVAWPQISFMSAYPDDVRNGYLLFVAAVVTVILISSGALASALGASPGKTVFGLTYVDMNDAPASAFRLWTRAFLLACVALLILLPGPILGFLFGSSADILSLFSLFAGFILVILTCFGLGDKPDQASYINRIAGVRLVRRSTQKED